MRCIHYAIFINLALLLTSHFASAGRKALLATSSTVKKQSENEPKIDLDKEYARLILYPVKIGSGSAEDAFNLRMRLTAWHLATQLEDQQMSVKGQIAIPNAVISFDYVCELYHLYLDNNDQRMLAYYKKHPEKLKQDHKQMKMQNPEMFKELGKEMGENRISHNTKFDSINSTNAMLKVDCAEMEKYARDPTLKPFGSAATTFFATVQKLHADELMRLMKAKKTADFWSHLKAHLDSEKNAVKDEETKGKEEAKEEIVVFSDKLIEAILKGLIRAKEPKEHDGAQPSTNVGAENEQWESEIGRIKSNLIDLIGAFHMVQLEWTNPFLTAMGTHDRNNEIRKTLLDGVLAKPSGSTHALREEHYLAINVLFKRIWKILFWQNGHNHEKMEENLRKLIKIVEKLEKLKIGEEITNVDKTLKVTNELYGLWMEMAEVVMEDWAKSDKNKKFAIIHEDLLWREYWQLLNRLKEEAYFLNFNYTPGQHARLAELYGGFGQIWSKLISNGSAQSKGEVGDKTVMALDGGKEATAYVEPQDFRAIFGIDLYDRRGMKMLRDYFEDLLKEESPDLHVKEIYELKKLVDYKKAKWLVDVLVYLTHLDEYFDNINDTQLTNQWWMEKVEVELFIDSIVDRSGKVELVTPAIDMINWMHLLHEGLSAAGDKHLLNEMKEPGGLHRHIQKCKEKGMKTDAGHNKEKELIDLAKLKQLRAQYLIEMLTFGNRRCFQTFVKMFARDMKMDENVQTVLQKLVGEENAQLILNLDFRFAGKTDEEKAQLYMDVLKESDPKKREEAEIEFLYELSKMEYEGIVDSANEDADSPDDAVRTRCENLQKAGGRIEEEIMVKGFELAKESGLPMDYIANKLRLINITEKLYEPIKNNDYAAIDTITANIMPLDEAKRDHGDLLKEIRHSKKNYILKMFYVRSFPQVLKKSEELQEVVKLRKNVGAIYRLSMILGYGTNAKTNERKRNIIEFWQREFLNKENLDVVRDKHFFDQDMELIEHYEKALSSADRFERVQNRLVANIIVTMRKLEKTWLLGKNTKITRHFVETMHLLFRIEYDKVLTIQDDVIATTNKEREKLKWKQLMKCAHLHSIIYEKLNIFETTTPENNANRWTQLLTLFQGEQGAMALLPSGTDMREEPPSYGPVMQLYHYWAIRDILRLSEENINEPNEAEISKNKEMEMERAESAMGKLLKANAHKDGRKNLQKFLTLDGINYMLQKIGLEADIDEKRVKRKKKQKAKKQNVEESEEDFDTAGESDMGYLTADTTFYTDDEKDGKKKMQIGREGEDKIPENGMRQVALLEGEQQKAIMPKTLAKEVDDAERPKQFVIGHAAPKQQEEQSTVNELAEGSSSGTLNRNQRGKQRQKAGKKAGISVEADTTVKHEGPIGCASNNEQSGADPNTHQENVGPETPKHQSMVDQLEEGYASDMASIQSSASNKSSSNKRKKKLKIATNKANQKTAGMAVKNVEYLPVSPNSEQQRILDKMKLEELAFYNLDESKIDDGKLREVTSTFSMQEFIHDEFLHKKLREFLSILANHQKAENLTNFLVVLVAGCYINEIEKRFIIGAELRKNWPKYFANGQQVDWENWELYEKKWRKEEMTGRLRGKIEFNKTEMKQFETDLHQILSDLTSMLNGDIDFGEYFNENEEEKLINQKLIKRQVFLSNLAKSLLLNKDNGIIKMDELEKDKKLKQNLFKILFIFYPPDEDTDYGRKELEQKMFEKFRDQFIMPWKILLEQQIIDVQICTDRKECNVNYLNLNWQKINFSQNAIKREIESVEKLKNLIGFFLPSSEMEKTKNLSAVNLRVDEAIGKVQQIVTQIFAPKTTLQFGGAYQLGTLTRNMEIDAILIASERLKKHRFFGPNIICEHESRHCDDRDSLYCIFCKDKHVFNLRKRPKSHIPIINFTYCTHFMSLKLNWEPQQLPEYQCVRFEISFVTLRGYGTISAQTLENTQLLIENFKMADEDIYRINWSDSRAGMINTLAGYQMNKDILNMLTTEQVREAFRISLIALKKWAKSNHIFSDVYGFLNDASLSLMLVKIMARYPTTSVPFLLEKFFLHYTIWPWPMPVQLAELGQNQSHFMEKTLGWRADKEIRQKKSMFTWRVEGDFEPLTMPIIAPGVPERNVAFNVNHSTAVIIKKELENGLTEIRKHLKHDGDIPWNDFLETNTFFHQKYDHYIVLHCMALDNDLLIEFCENYVVQQLRLQLIFTVERRNGIELCHIMPDSERKQVKKVSEKVQRKLPEEFKNSDSKYWLIGARMKQGYDAGYTGVQSDSSTVFKVKMNILLNNKETGFTHRFKLAFLEYLEMDKENMVSQYEVSAKFNRVYLHAEFLERTDNLADWYPLKEKWVKKEDEKKPAAGR